MTETPTIYPLHDVYRAVRSEATARAGAPSDMVHRARHYLQIYQHSGGNFAFALLAAHGALWGLRYFHRGRWVGHGLAWLDASGEAERALLRSELETLAQRLREIHRQVFIEAYTVYHFTNRAGREAGAGGTVDGALVDLMTACHAARRDGRLLDLKTRRDLFRAMYDWEQTNGVASAVTAAVAACRWPRALALAMRPRIVFPYMPWRDRVRFNNFADVSERVARALQAFDSAERVGWDRAQDTLAPASARRYGLSLHPSDCANGRSQTDP